MPCKIGVRPKPINDLGNVHDVWAALPFFGISASHLNITSVHQPLQDHCAAPKTAFDNTKPGRYQAGRAIFPKITNTAESRLFRGVHHPSSPGSGASACGLGGAAGASADFVQPATNIDAKTIVSAANAINTRLIFISSPGWHRPENAEHTALPAWQLPFRPCGPNFKVLIS
jgi:hypothetical protein